MIRPMLITVIALTAAGSPVAVAAQEPRTEHVSYVGLDLQSSAGRDTLRRRVHSAMLRVCDPRITDALVASRLSQRCMKATQPSVDAQLAAIGLTPPTNVRVLVAAR